jgi:hypothetical protein
MPFDRYGITPFQRQDDCRNFRLLYGAASALKFVLRFNFSRYMFYASGSTFVRLRFRIFFSRLSVPLPILRKRCAFVRAGGKYFSDHINAFLSIKIFFSLTLDKSRALC